MEIKKEKNAFLFTEILHSYLPKCCILIYQKSALLFTVYTQIIVNHFVNNFSDVAVSFL